LKQDSDDDSSRLLLALLLLSADGRSRLADVPDCCSSMTSFCDSILVPLWICSQIPSRNLATVASLGAGTSEWSLMRFGKLRALS